MDRKKEEGERLETEKKENQEKLKLLQGEFEQICIENSTKEFEEKLMQQKINILQGEFTKQKEILEKKEAEAPEAMEAFQSILLLIKEVNLFSKARELGEIKEKIKSEQRELEEKEIEEALGLRVGVLRRVMEERAGTLEQFNRVENQLKIIVESIKMVRIMNKKGDLHFLLFIKMCLSLYFWRIY